MTRLGRLIGPVALLLALAACGTTVSGLKDREETVKENIDRIAVEAVKTSVEARETMRRAGRPVMVVRGDPAYLYRDFQMTTGPAQRVMPRPQETQDVPGCVTVSYDIRPDGKTDGFEIESSTPPGVFDKAALRAVLATEYEPAATRPPRQRRSLWFLVARPPRTDVSKLNESIEADRNKEREAQRAACEGPPP